MLYGDVQALGVTPDMGIIGACITDLDDLKLNQI
jgi:hypothetical protein